MHATRRSLALLAAVGGLACAPAAHAAADHTVTVSPDALKADWAGATSSALNTSFFLDGTAPGQKGTCAKDPNTMCETTLVHATGDALGGGKLTLRIDGFAQYSDFDLRAYESDASGTVGKYLGSPTSDNSKTSPLGGNDPRNTAAGDYESKAIDIGGYLDETGKLDAYFLVEVPYFIVANDSYKGHATLSDLTPFEPPTDEG